MSSDQEPGTDNPNVRSQMSMADMTCPVPLTDYPNVIMGHGGGGKLSAELIEHLFLPALGNDTLRCLGDAAVFQTPKERLAMTTDSYVVRPLFFPGGSIGELAVNGTVNDLAMVGASPLYLTAAFIIEEGFPIAMLDRIAKRMGTAARQAGVAIIAGDTKVVEKGQGGGCYINTSGVGVVPVEVDIASANARPGDAVIISGTIGDHGMAIMSVREGLEFDSPIESDTAPLAGMVAKMIDICGDIHTLRDPTRGGLAASLNEIASASRCGVEIDEVRLPITPAVQAACEILGLEPMVVANEGKLVCIVPADFADAVLAAMRSTVVGAQAQIIGRVVDRHPGIVVAKTAIGAVRVIPMPFGEQMPRIC